MKPPLVIRSLQITPLAIPMRLKFEHAAASRAVADPVMVRVTAGAPYAEHEGYGETLARPYVTGETPKSVTMDIEGRYAPLLREFRAASFSEALAFIDQLPHETEGRLHTAARSAVELALLDLAGKAFGRRAADAAGWLDLPGFGAPGCLPTASYSGEVVGSSRWRMQALLRIQLAYGLRDFKIKVGVDGWEQKLAWAHGVLQPRIAGGSVTLRADANAAWSLAEAHDCAEVLEQYGVSALEQPLPDVNDADLPYLAEQTRCHLIADESLVTLDDAERLISDRGVRVLNIRIAKNGGLLPALKIARRALVGGLDVQLGCMVGESAILSAAGVAFLEMCPRVRFVEGAFGALLLKKGIGDSVRFGYRGRMRARPGSGLGVRVRRNAIEALAAETPRLIRF